MNRFARVTIAVAGALDPAELADIAPHSVSARSDEPNRWLNVTGEDASSRSFPGERTTAGAHDAAIHSFCLCFDRPFTWDALNATLQALTALRGPDLLRVKGIVHVAGEKAPVVVQGAQHVFHPPVALAEGQATEPRSRIVFIVRGIPRESIEALFAAVGALGR
jgi:G3E family GTPase